MSLLTTHIVTCASVMKHQSAVENAQKYLKGSNILYFSLIRYKIGGKSKLSGSKSLAIILVKSNHLL